jgi:CubicO group peptidase (beta-lactamase class C family)
MPRIANVLVRTCGSLAVAACVLQASAVAQAPTAGFDVAALNRIDEVVADAIKARQLPGAVVVVGRGDQVVFRKAYGQRAIQPSPEPMTMDTIFDLASLTKVVATTPSVMMLVEQGRIRLTDPVASFIPEFAKYGKDRVTVRDLMTHMSGLRPDVDLGDPWVGSQEAIRLATEEVLTQPAGPAASSTATSTISCWPRSCRASANSHFRSSCSSTCSGRWACARRCSLRRPRFCRASRPRSPARRTGGRARDPR